MKKVSIYPKSYLRFHAQDIKNLGIVVQMEPLFQGVKPIQPSSWLIESLNNPISIKLDAEKAKSEFIIAPIISETVRRNAQKVAVFSGYAFEVDPDKGLTGTCDYILTTDPEAESIEAPVFFLVEAKNENLITGAPQCIAELFAAQIFNGHVLNGKFVLCPSMAVASEIFSVF